jgi:NTE family protein
VDNASYFEKLFGSVTRIVRHSYYPGKEEAIELCLEEVTHLRIAGRITDEQLETLHELLTGEESSCLLEGILREREHPDETAIVDRIAIVCQGTGSQAAFTAGVLQGLLQESLAGCEIAALSGTSCGALSALVAWEGLLRGGHGLAGEQLEQFWHEYSAHSAIDAFLNVSTQMVLHLRSLVPLGGLTSYGLPTSVPGKEGWRWMLQRRIDFDEARTLATRDGAPGFVVGSMDSRGEVELLRGTEITADAVLDATAVVHGAGPVGLESHAPRDGSRLPVIPMRALMKFHPTELWMIEIQKSDRGDSLAFGRDLDEPDGVPARLLLEQEIRFLQKINRLLERGSLIDGHYRHIEVHRIVMDHDLGDLSKFDRSPAFIARMMSYGRDRAAQFLEKRRRGAARRPPACLVV